MSTATQAPPQRKQWDTRRTEKRRRLDAVRQFANGPVLQQADMVAVLEALLAPGDRVVLEGNNQKQADFLAR
ncbi:malonate decarboxylase subunit alpha, partial [Methylobacterium nigriterrae]|uniref:malonate decarboxylase subunit alpha n=1 Tax=Methylobacterium nigriterrae TaxID=3127512 RepID=UPI003013BEF6